MVDVEKYIQKYYKEKVYVPVSISIGLDNDCPIYVEGLIQQLQDLPPQCRITIRAESYDYSSGAYLETDIDRLETDEEFEQRKQIVREQLIAQNNAEKTREQEDRALYEKLKKKFEKSK